MVNPQLPQDTNKPTCKWPSVMGDHEEHPKAWMVHTESKVANYLRLNRFDDMPEVYTISIRGNDGRSALR